MNGGMENEEIQMGYNKEKKRNNVSRGSWL